MAVLAQTSVPRRWRRWSIALGDVVGPSTPVVLYCFKGARAPNTLVALKEAGITDVRMYFGSWNEWSRDPNLPIESGLPFALAAE